MSQCQKAVAEIISELSRTRKLPQPYRDQDDDVPFPGQLGVGDGQFIFISKKVDQLIADIARTMRRNASLQGQFTTAEYLQLVRRAFGPALAETDLDADPADNSPAVLANVEAKVANDVDWTLSNGRREHAFGCTFFVHEDVEPVDIGPVRFEPREVWLARKASDGRSARVGVGGRIERFDHQIADGPISGIAKRRILRAWQGRKLRRRKPSVDARGEQHVIAAIGDCRYVCSVEMPGIGDKAGDDKALLAARLALTSISLIWLNSSKALNGLNLLFDREMRRQSVLSFTSDGLILGGGMKSSMPHAPWLPREELKQLLGAFSGEFSVAGEAIAWLLDPAGTHKRPAILSILAQAMMWFHDGCREVTDLKAIVSFASCLDILAGGGGRDSIIKLIRARLGIDGNAQLHRDGFTIKEVIDQIYDDGRTRFVHGPIRSGKHVWGGKLGHDWSETRGLAEWLARRCLVFCMDRAANNPASDDPKQLLC